MTLHIEIRLGAPDQDEPDLQPHWSSTTDWQQLAGHAILAALTASDYGPYPDDVQVIVELFLTDNSAITRLNGTYRGKPQATNVLSFQATDRAGLARPVGPLLLGSIVLAYETCASEAAIQKKAFLAHVSHLIIHGTLHLLDYDHECDTKAVEMENIERLAMATLNYPDPYGDT